MVQWRLALVLHGARDVGVIISQRFLCSQLWSRRAARLTERAIVVHCNVKIDWFVPEGWSGGTEKEAG